MAELRLQVGIGIGPEACPLVTSELSSLDFLINRFFMKMFRTNNIEIVRNCQCQVSCGVKRFDVKYATSRGSF